MPRRACLSQQWDTIRPCRIESDSTEDKSAETSKCASPQEHHRIRQSPLSRHCLPLAGAAGCGSAYGDLGEGVQAESGIGVAIAFANRHSFAAVPTLPS